MAKSKKTTRKSKKTKGNSILDKIKQEWNASEPAGGGGDYEDLPDGAYQVRIDKAEIEESKNSGRAQIKFEMTVVSGEYANRKVWKYDGLDNAKSISYTRGGLARLGVEVEDIDDLGEALEELIGTYATINIKTRGEYTNTYFKEALDDDEVDLDGVEEEDAEEEEDVEEAEEDEEDEEEDDDEEEEEAPKKSKKSKKSKSAPKSTKKKKKVEEEEEEDDEDDEEEEVDEEEDEEEDEEGDEEEGEEEGVSLKFKTVSKVQKKTLLALAKKHDVDPKMYDSDLELAADVAEYLGLSGEYKSSKTFFAELKEADED